jgi:hypothetical protein
MKKIKRIGFNLMVLIIPGMVLFGSCVEQPLEDDTRIVGSTEDTIDDLKVSEFFEWKTTQEITVNIEGLPVDVSVNRKLALLTASGDEIFAGSHNMHEDFEMTFDLPLDIKKITMKYGATEKSGDILNKTVDFTFESEREVEVPVVTYPEITLE